MNNEYARIDHGKKGVAYAHREVVERALGRKLKSSERIHHVNGDKRDNRRDNLVVCPDDKYHRLLHLRQEAYANSGDASYRRCQFCHTWSSPNDLYIGAKVVWHRRCFAAYKPKEYTRKRGQQVAGQQEGGR